MMQFTINSDMWDLHANEEGDITLRKLDPASKKWEWRGQPVAFGSITKKPVKTLVNQLLVNAMNVFSEEYAEDTEIPDTAYEKVLYALTNFVTFDRDTLTLKLNDNLPSWMDDEI